jgi:hypothetical protein
VLVIEWIAVPMRALEDARMQTSTDVLLLLVLGDEEEQERFVPDLARGIR